MNPNYEKIKKACLLANPKLMEVNPEIEELFGCLLDFLDRYKCVWGGCLGGGWGLVGEIRIKYEASPREPQLSDVLMAINQNDDLHATYLIDTVGEFYTLNINEYKRTVKFWSLSKPLKDQSPETLQFIADLL